LLRSATGGARAAASILPQRTGRGCELNSFHRQLDARAGKDAASLPQIEQRWVQNIVIDGAPESVAAPQRGALICCETRALDAPVRAPQESNLLSRREPTSITIP